MNVYYTKKKLIKNICRGRTPKVHIKLEYKYKSVRLISYKADGLSFSKCIIRLIGWLRPLCCSDRTVHRMEQTSGRSIRNHEIFF